MTQADKNLDELISEALDAEDRELLDTYAKEPGFISQALGLFSGTMGWVMAVVLVMVLLFTGLMVWTGIKFFSTSDPVMSLRWGLGCIASIQIIVFMRGVMMQKILTNQVLREVKRLELQIARHRHDDD